MREMKKRMGRSQRESKMKIGKRRDLRVGNQEIKKEWCTLRPSPKFPGVLRLIRRMCLSMKGPRDVP
eukprot:9456947-Karenia_brevis.AAC.1